jgi:flavin reductase (DIM6/NTAB) family NADH-FMN oxidoreductase RutF
MLVDPQSLSPGAMYQFMIACIVPRPIAFVSTVGENGVLNVAPFSYFAPLTSRPPLLGISIHRRAGEPKDTLRNLRATGEFVVNLVNEPLLDRMVLASGEWPPEVSEFELAGLTPHASLRVRPPRVAECPIALECRLHREIELGEASFVVGEILYGHADDAVLTGEGRVDPLKLKPIGRLGSDGYTIVHEVVRRARPVVKPAAR